jgi:peroxiredoxin
MQHVRRTLLAAGLLSAALPAPAHALGLNPAGSAGRAVPGQPAPAFTLADLSGKKVSLADFRGRFVVLEWWNAECYAINAHYDSGNMQALQAEARERDVVWLSIDSTHPGHASFVDAAIAAEMLRRWQGNQSAMLLDPDGSVARAFGARVTPQMFVIDPRGVIVYSGAIDDQRSVRNPKSAHNFVRAALADALAGRPVAVAATNPYG